MSDQPERTRRAVISGIPVAATVIVGWGAYRHVDERFAEVEERCREKYGKDNYTIVTNDSGGSRIRMECDPNAA